MGLQATTDTPHSFALFDALLGEYRPFGDSDYIHEQMRAAYRRRLSKISESVPIAGELLDALQRADSDIQYRVLGDTVMRCTIQHALTQVVTRSSYGLPLDDCEEIFREGLRHVLDRRPCGLLESNLPYVDRLGAESWYGWIWSEDYPEDVFGRALRYLIREHYGESLATPSPAEVAMLRKGASLLGELVPSLSRSALSHAPLVALFPSVGRWKTKASSSQYRLSGIIFLSRDALHNPWWIAEHLFHESLHQKLYDFRHAHSLLARDVIEADDPPSEIARPVVSIWNFPGLNQLNHWDTHRAVAAFHVYVHLALLCSIAEHRAAELEAVYGPPQSILPTMTECRQSFDRAHYLGERLRDTCWPELGLAGQRLIGWLSSVLDALDPSPPPPGARLHLLLDRYLLEGRMVGRTSASSESTGVLTDLIDDELRQVRAVLSVVDPTADLDRFEACTAHEPGEAAAARFARVRGHIGRTLLEMLTDGYGFRCTPSISPDPDEMVREMVETSSKRLAESGAAGT